MCKCKCSLAWDRRSSAELAYALENFIKQCEDKIFPAVSPQPPPKPEE